MREFTEEDMDKIISKMPEWRYAYKYNVEFSLHSDMMCIYTMNIKVSDELIFRYDSHDPDGVFSIIEDFVIIRKMKDYWSFFDERRNNEISVVTVSELTRLLNACYGITLL